MSDVAGQTTAGASQSAGTTLDISDLTNTLNNNITQAIQDNSNLLVDGAVSTWDQVRTVSTAQGFYHGTGSADINYTPAGSAMLQGHGYAEFSMDVFFGERMVQADVNLRAPNFNSVVDHASLVGTFDTAQGNAVVGGHGTVMTGAMTGDLGTWGAGTTNNGNFEGTKITLINAGGVAAGTAQLDLQYALKSFTSSSAGDKLTVIFQTSVNTGGAMTATGSAESKMFTDECAAFGGMCLGHH